MLIDTWYEKQTKGLPKIFFSGEVRGASYKGSVVLMVHNLVVDEDHREAYFPIVTGLSFTPPAGAPEADLTAAGQDFVAWEPSTWNEEERAAFWKFLNENLEKNVREKIHEDEEATETPEKDPEAVHFITADDKSVHFFNADEMAAMSSAPSVALEALVAVGSPPPERRTVGVAFGNTRASAGAYEIIRYAHKITLPKKWSTLKRWEDLVDAEVQTLQKKEEKRREEAEKKRAAEELLITPGDQEERTPYLRPATNADGKEVQALTDAGMDNLRRRVSRGSGYINVNQYGQECWSRLLEISGGGFLELGYSWQGLAGPLADEWRKEYRRKAEELGKDQGKELTLFKELETKQKKELDNLLSRLTLWKDGRGIMDVILGQVGKQGRNPVEIPAETFRVLLWPERAKTRDWPDNWKQRIEGALSVLHALTFTLRTYGVRRSEKVNDLPPNIWTPRKEWDTFQRGGPTWEKEKRDDGMTEPSRKERFGW
jgi:hypothetical protein